MATTEEENRATMNGGGEEEMAEMADGGARERAAMRREGEV
jgi:hypothetical protein